jgi:hypothetical protein
MTDICDCCCDAQHQVPVVMLNIKCLITVVGKQGKSVIEPASRVVDFYIFFETLLDIFHGLQDVPSAVLLHVVLGRAHCLSQPVTRSGVTWTPLWQLLSTNCLCCGAHILAENCVLWWKVMQCTGSFAMLLTG